MVRLRSPAPNGGFPERPKGADCKSVVTDFGGPNPPSPTKKALAKASAFFIQSEGLAWHPSLCDGMESRRRRVWHHASACIYLRIDSIHHFVMVPFAPSSRFHAACGGFHTRLRRDLARSLALSTILCYTNIRKAVGI